MESNGLTILLTSDPLEDPDKCSMAFSIANTALATDIAVKMFFADKGAMILKKGYVEGIQSSHFAPISDMISLFHEAGGELFICRPFMLACNIEEEDLVDGVTIASAPTLVFTLANSNVITL